MRKVPAEGWIVELAAAERAATETSESQLRIAAAAYRLRQWRKCKTAATLGLTLLDPEGGERVRKVKKELTLYQTIATTEYAEYKTKKDGALFKKMQEEVFKNDQSIEHIRVHHMTYGNLNLLQFAAVTGNLVLLEEAVALGAAIDFPVLDVCDAGSFSAPPGTTALLLVCQGLALYGKAGNPPGLMNDQLKQQLQGTEACAIALVQLGADCDKALQRPDNLSSATSPFDPSSLAEKFQFWGKTARELATISKKPKLISVMQEFATQQDLINKAHCRCGSRLPWLQCHAGEKVGRVSHYYEPEKGGRLAFRYSPLARCCCKHTQKTHFKCCWRDTARPSYQEDTTARLCGTQVLPVGNDPHMKMMADVVSLMKEYGMEGMLNQPMFPGSDSNNKQSVCKMIRSASSLTDILGQGNVHPKEIIGTWDTEVYAGCVERIDKWFLWSSCHWKIDKPELLARVKEWNEALEVYCIDKGLTGAEREAVIVKHTASPYAPCANPRCDKVETECKEYGRCTRCKRFSYCGQACQKADWKHHKQECIPLARPSPDMT